MIRKTEPFEYQKTAIKTASNNLLHNYFCPLFAEMGTGKTIMSLYTAVNFFERDKLSTVIIVCPKVLVSTWKQQIDEHLDLSELRGSVYAWEGSTRSCSRTYGFEFEKFLKASLRFYIINIESFSASKKNRYLEDELCGRFDKEKTLVLIDESSKIKSPSANRTIHLIRFGNQYKYRMILTGTEITNTVLDIFAQFEFLKFGFWEKVFTFLPFNSFRLIKNWGIFKARYASLEPQFGAMKPGLRFKINIEELNNFIAETRGVIMREDIDCLTMSIFKNEISTKTIDDVLLRYKNKIDYETLRSLRTKYGTGREMFDKIVGFKNVNELTNTVQPYIVRLKKKDCLDLPEKIFQIVELDMPAMLRKIYDTLKHDLYVEYKSKGLSVIQKIALFTRFRQLCGNFVPVNRQINLDGEIEFVKEAAQYIDDNPKLEYILEESEDTDKKASIWCSFVPEIEKIKEIISKEYTIETIYGKTKQNEIMTIQNKFRNESRFCCISLSKGAYGLNLQFCDLSFVYTIPISSEYWRQFQDRHHRVGLKNNVTYKILLYKNSVEERIYKLNGYKEDLASKFSSMSLDDVFDFI